MLLPHEELQLHRNACWAGPWKCRRRHWALLGPEPQLLAAKRTEERDLPSAKTENHDSTCKLLRGRYITSVCRSAFHTEVYVSSPRCVGRAREAILALKSPCYKIKD